MKQNLRLFWVITFLLLNLSVMSGQKKLPSYVNYEKKYSNMAIRQMKKHKIPASITLAQGILESGAGMSKLAQETNNHFGIKCTSGWTGAVFYRKVGNSTECFRKYKKVENSFEDHSLFLKRNRYAKLFKLNIRDYKAWAKGLQACGYATDKNYADKLIRIIYIYRLDKYDSSYQPKTKVYQKSGKPPVRPSTQPRRK